MWFAIELNIATTLLNIVTISLNIVIISLNIMIILLNITRSKLSHLNELCVIFLWTHYIILYTTCSFDNKLTQYRIITLWFSHILFMITTTKLINSNLTNEINLSSSCNLYYISLFSFFLLFFFFLKSTSSKRTKNIVHVISRDEMTNDWEKKNIVMFFYESSSSSSIDQRNITYSLLRAYTKRKFARPQRWRNVNKIKMLFNHDCVIRKSLMIWQRLYLIFAFAQLL